MKLLKGINKDLDYANQISGTYRSATNLALSKDGDRLESEPGSTLVKRFSSDEVLIGVIKAGTEIISFVINNDTGNLRIYRYNKTLTTLILDTAEFTVSVESPIQGEYKYNYKKELVILFYSDIDIPRILNIDTLNEIVGSDLELLTDKEIFTRQSVTFFEPQFILKEVSSTGGNLLSGIYQLAIQYKLLDDSYTNFSLLSNPIPVYKFNPKDDWFDIYANESGIETSKSIIFNLETIDTRFTEFRFGVVYKTSTSTKAYVTRDYNLFSNAGTNLVISNKDSFTEISLSDILVKNINLSRIGASTSLNNSLYLGNVKILEPIKYQKYACNIATSFVCTDTVTLTQYKDSYKDETILFLDKSYMPFEIYAFYIRFINKIDGTVSDAFHIPGRDLYAEELEPDLNKNSLDIYPSGDLKKYHLNDYAGTYGTRTNQMSGWENINETYPNDDEFDGTVDYDGNPIVGTSTYPSRDLRNTNVKHHRFPSLSKLYDVLSTGYSSKLLTSTNTLEQPIIITFAVPDTDWSNPFRPDADHPVKFKYTDATEGEFMFGNMYKNTTGAEIQGYGRFYFPRIKSLGYNTIHLFIYEFDEDLNYVNTFGSASASYDYITGISTLEYDETLSITLPANHILFVKIYKDSIGGFEISDKSSVRVEFTKAIIGDERIESRKLGIKFDNIVIPEYIANTCSHFEILYAERSTSNMSVLGQALLRPQSDTDKTNFRAYNFDILNNKPSINLSAVKPEVTLINGVSGSSTNVVDNNSEFASEAININVIPVTKSRYILQDVGYTDPDNTRREEHIALELDAFEEINVNDEDTNIVSLLSFKPDVYTNFYNQTLVRTGKLFEIKGAETRSTSLLDEGGLYGGDVVNNVYGITTFSNVPYNSGEEQIKYYAIPIFSVSNIGYRFTDEDPINIFFPKYNMISANGGYTDLEENTNGVLNRTTGNTSILSSIVSLHPDRFENESLIHMWLLEEKYGYENVIHSINNIEPAIIFSINNNFVAELPHRIYRTLPSLTESLADTWRQLKPTQYYDSAYDRGEIVQLDNDGSNILIEHRNALFIIKSLSELQINQDVVASLGSSDIFDSRAIEIISDDSGYVGCQSKFGSIKCKFGNIIVDRERGKIFIYNNGKIEEITRNGLSKWFATNLQYNISDYTMDTEYIFDDSSDVQFDDAFDMVYAYPEELQDEIFKIDNPYNNLGIFTAYDDKFERLIFTKNNNYLDANYSWVLSYYPAYKIWVSFHTYISNMMVDNRLGVFMYSSLEQGMFKMFNTTIHGDYFVDGLPHHSSILACFATPFKVDKKVQSFEWSTEVEPAISTLATRDYYSEDYDNLTFKYATVLTKNSHSYLTKLILQDYEDGNIRNTNGTWKYNDFMNVFKENTTYDLRLVLLDPLSIDELVTRVFDNSSSVSNWYDKSNFVNPYILINLDHNYGRYLLDNTGIYSTTDLVDTDGNGFADNFSWDTVGVVTPSIVTGNGFIHNAQRIVCTTTNNYNAIVYITSNATNYVLETGLVSSQRIKVNTTYYFRFKYRSNSVFKVGERGNYHKEGYVSIAANTGDAIYATGSFTTNDDVRNSTLFAYGWFYPDSHTTGDWIEISEIALSEDPLPIGDKIMINDISMNSILTPRI